MAISQTDQYASPARKRFPRLSEFNGPLASFIHNLTSGNVGQLVDQNDISGVLEGSLGVPGAGGAAGMAKPLAGAVKPAAKGLATLGTGAAVGAGAMARGVGGKMAGVGRKIGQAVSGDKTVRAGKYVAGKAASAGKAVAGSAARNPVTAGLTAASLTTALAPRFAQGYDDLFQEQQTQAPAEGPQAAPLTAPPAMDQSVYNIDDDPAALAAMLNGQQPDMTPGTPAPVQAATPAQGPAMSTEQQLLNSIMQDPTQQPRQPEKRPGLMARVGESLSNFGNRYRGTPTRAQERTSDALQQEELRRSQATPDPVKQQLLQYALGQMGAENQLGMGEQANQRAQMLEFLLKQQMTGGMPSQTFEAGQADLDRQNRIEVARAAGLPPEVLAYLRELNAGGGGGPRVNPIQ